MRNTAQKTSIDNRKDILLLLLFSPGVENKFNEPIVGRTRLVKMLFLFDKELMSKFKKNIDIEEIKFYNFYPWNFGPFSKEVYDDLNFFILRGFISSSNLDNDVIEEAFEEMEIYNNEFLLYDEETYQEEEFRLTEKGEKFTKELYENLTEQQQKNLQEFKSRLSSIPLRAILRYVYEEYPQMIHKSTIKETILNN